MVRKGKLLKSVSSRFGNKTQYMHGPQKYSLREKLQSCIWIFTIGDADDKPSVPHAHAKDKGYKLDAWTGCIYPAGNEREKIIGKLKNKELYKLHSNPCFLAFAKKQIEWYRSANPHISFYVPEWFELKSKKSRFITMIQKKEVDKFVFLGRAFINQ